MSHRMNRRHYAEMFGPTTGDRVRLGDTSLILEVERETQATIAHVVASAVCL